MSDEEAAEALATLQVGGWCESVRGMHGCMSASIEAGGEQGVCVQQRGWSQSAPSSSICEPAAGPVFLCCG